jgi:hypothetical protein
MLNRFAKYLAAAILAVFLSNSFGSYFNYAKPPLTHSSQQEDQEKDEFEVEAVLPKIQVLLVKYVQPSLGTWSEKHIWVPERFELPELEPPSFVL